MRCCECQFRRGCNEVESDDVSFSLCRTRITKLSEIELNRKLEELKKIDAMEAANERDTF